MEQNMIVLPNRVTLQDHQKVGFSSTIYLIILPLLHYVFKLTKHLRKNENNRQCLRPVDIIIIIIIYGSC